MALEQLNSLCVRDKLTTALLLGLPAGSSSRIFLWGVGSAAMFSRKWIGKLMRSILQNICSWGRWILGIWSGSSESRLKMRWTMESGLTVRYRLKLRQCTSGEWTWLPVRGTYPTRNWSKCTKYQLHSTLCHCSSTYIAWFPTLFLPSENFVAFGGLQDYTWVFRKRQRSKYVIWVAWIMNVPFRFWISLSSLYFFTSNVSAYIISLYGGLWMNW